MNSLENINESLFENIKHINEYGQEYWIARELIQVLGYNEYRFFKKVILKAIDACKASNNEVSDHFVQVHGMVNIGSGAQRALEDYHLSRYACYLIAMNGDSRKKAIALAQTYFAVKTRQQEIIIMGPLSRPRSKILRVAVSRIILSSEASKVKLVGNLVA